ncbi:MAG: diol dehydratase small subunit [Anaerolineales bacterium]|nr:diol dehydratase small subunit [Anaerolineales bacterium]
MSAVDPRYPLFDHVHDQLRPASGRPLAAITAEAAACGELTMADLQISADTLRAQAQVARAGGYPLLAENLTRAAELTAVPNAEVLKMYSQLRPGRSTAADLETLAAGLEADYHAPACARLVREAAEAYRLRGLLRPGST